MIELINGDAREYGHMVRDNSIVIIDPPWDSPELFAVAAHAKNKIVFADGKRCGDAVLHHGSPTWVFVWDCVTSWFTPNRPLKRFKMALWYGDIQSYRQDGAHYGHPCGRPRMVKNTRGDHLFIPDDRGKMLSDLYQFPITQLRRMDGQQFNQSKPFEWVNMLVANCRGGSDHVVDLFAGSGVFMDVAKNNGMRYTGIEIDIERYNLLIARSCRVRQRSEKQEQLSWL